MPNTGASLNGTTVNIPGVYVADTVIVQPNPLPVTPPLIVIGYGQGPAPQSVTPNLTPQDFVALVRGGAVTTFAPYLETPSPELSGTGTITFIDCSENTQASSTIKSTATGTPTLVNIETTAYGLPSNLMQLEIAAGSVAGFGLTLFDGYANNTYFGDDLGVPFQIAYTGTVTGGATLAITGTAGDALSLTLTDGGSGNVTVPLSAYTSVSSIVEYINGTGYYTADLLSATQGQLNPTLLDITSGVNLPKPTSSVPTFENVTAIIPDAVLWLNQFTGQAVTATQAAVASTPTTAFVLQPLTHFTGATSVPPTTQDYANAFNVAASTAGFSIFADSNAPAVRALGNQHAQMMTAIGGQKNRRFYTGSTVGDSVATTLTAADTMSSRSTVYCYPGLNVLSATTGLPTLVGGLYCAAAAAAISVGNPANTPLTMKQIGPNVIGPEVNLTVSQIGNLDNGGVTVINVSPSANDNVTRFIRGLTTWQADDSPQNFSEQMSKERDYLAYSMRNALKPYVGSIASTQTETAIGNATKATLNALLYANNTNGVLQAWDPNSLIIVYTGANEVCGVYFNCTLLGENAFIFVNIGLEEENITIQIAA